MRLAPFRPPNAGVSHHLPPHEHPRNVKEEGRGSGTRSDVQMTDEQRFQRFSTSRSTQPTRSRADLAWIGIPLLTSVFQFIRDAPTDGAVFLGVGLVLLADRYGLLRFSRSLPVPRRALVVGGGLVVFLLLTVLPRYSIADGVIVAAIGLSVLPYAWTHGRVASVETSSAEAARDSAELTRRHPPPRDPARHGLHRSAVLWAILGIALCLWELGSFFLGMPSPTAEYAHPPLSDLIDPLLDPPLGRAICVALWLLGGAALLRRGRQ